VLNENNTPMRSDFYFIRPNGVRIVVAIEDTVPPTVNYVVPASDTWTVKPSQEDLQRYASLISNIKLGPRELVEKIFDKNIDNIAFLGVDMLLNIDRQQDGGVVNPWLVSYDDLSKKTSTLLFASPETGEIVKRYTSTLSPQN